MSDIVACEVVRALESAYGFGRSEIAAVRNQLLHARHLKFRSAKLMLEALEAYEASKGDFAAYLTRADAIDAGRDAVLTFDKALHRERHFRAP